VLIRFASGRDGAALGAYLERLLHFDKTASVRLVGVGPAVAAYTGPPFGGRRCSRCGCARCSRALSPST
jgi:hypothetical protein